MHFIKCFTQWHHLKTHYIKSQINYFEGDNIYYKVLMLCRNKFSHTST
jgi:hypothetical protein